MYAHTHIYMYLLWVFQGMQKEEGPAAGRRSHGGQSGGAVDSLHGVQFAGTRAVSPSDGRAS